MRAPVLALGLLLVACGRTADTDAHVHGNGELNIAVEEERSALIELIVPAESIYGFEHAEASDTEIRAQADALARLRDEIASLVQPPAEHGCALDAHAVDVVASGEPGDDGALEHREVHATYSLQCQRALEGARLQIRFGEAFTGLERLHVVLQSSTGRRSLTLDGARGAVDL